MRPMRRRSSYALAGALLSAGAPLGLLGIRLAVRGPVARSFSLQGALREVTDDPADYLYIGASTAAVFIGFGYLLGRQADWLAMLSETDALTGLPNARAFFDRLHSEVARVRRYREPLALLLVDLDDLKGINDRYGHHAGDAAIRALADVIRSELRETDFGARWGGDEFAVLAPNTSKSAALELAERIRTLIPPHRFEWPMSGSVGVAAIDPAAGGTVVDSSTLMRTADIALYEAKRRGRNRVVIETSARTAAAGQP